MVNSDDIVTVPAPRDLGSRHLNTNVTVLALAARLPTGVASASQLES